MSSIDKYIKISPIWFKQRTKSQELQELEKAEKELAEHVNLLFYNKSILEFEQRVNVFHLDVAPKKYFWFTNNRLMKNILLIMI